MRMLRFVLPVLALTLVLAGVAVVAAEAEYVGESKCKMCHKSEHETWSGGAHAKALEVLEEKDRTNPECLACHQTGHGKAAAAGAELAGVQCEACHGPGSLYKSPKIMSKTAYKDDPDGARAGSLAAGLMVPDAKTCEGCHNAKSPTFKGFDYQASLAKIKHWD